MITLTQVQLKETSGAGNIGLGNAVFSAGMGAIASQAMQGAIRGSIAGPAGMVVGAITGAAAAYGAHTLYQHLNRPMRKRS